MNHKNFLTLAALCFFLPALSVFTQETESKMAFGYGIDFNMNSQNGMGGGAVFCFDYNLPASFAMGVSTAISGGSYGDGTLELTAMGRRYFFSEGRHLGFFAQADVGTSIIILGKTELAIKREWDPKFHIGVRSGYRFHLGRLFYVEPYGRFGYPFAMGIGVMGGLRF